MNYGSKVQMHILDYLFLVTQWIYTVMWLYLNDFKISGND